MHIVTVILMILGALAVLVWGLLRVLCDLLERGPYDAPLVEEAPRQRGQVGWSVDGHPGGDPTGAAH